MFRSEPYSKYVLRIKFDYVCIRSQKDDVIACSVYSVLLGNVLFKYLLWSNTFHTIWMTAVIAFALTEYIKQ